MLRNSFELTLSLAVILLLAPVYIVYELLSTPAGGHPFGHALGILGATLMLMTELLYSARKRWRLIRYGQVRHWLSFHIFTGIVGPALVLLHTGMAFQGFAGLTMLLTVTVVASGFLGRYIYTAVPRTLAGIEVNRRTLEAETMRRQQALTAWSADKSARVQTLVQHEIALAARRQQASPLQVLTRALHEAGERRRVRKAIRRLEHEEQLRLAEVERLLSQQRRLQQQIDSLRAVRQLMSWWHTFHVPLGLTLFSAMFIHIFAASYYGGL